MPTAQELVDLSTRLTDIVKAINTIVGKQQLPFDATTTKLSNTAATLAIHANSIGQAGLDALANNVRGAIGQLSDQVQAANAALQQIQDVKRALSIVSIILGASASIAGSVASGNWGGVAGDIVTCVNNLKNAITGA